MAVARSKTTGLGVGAKRWHRTSHDPAQMQWIRAAHPSFRSHATAAAPLSERSYGDPSPLPSTEPPSSLNQTGRIESLKSAKPFSSFLTDTFNRQHDYLRISITERCNLRCLYCMPAEGVPLSPKKHLLTPPEILYLSSLFVSQGVSKIRLTGGEPTVHPQILPLLRDIGSLRRNGLRELALTTNGLTLARKLDSMVESGVTGINLSLDTLDPFQFEIMTRRRGFDQVMKSINQILEMKRLGANLKLKVNAVVIRGLNDEQVLPFVEMTRDKDIEVRFIEYMPFDGNKWSSQKMLSYQEMLAIIREKFADVEKVQDHPNDTSKTFKIPGFVGRIGFITSMTEHFCGSCNRLRITSDGNLKVCLFGNAEVSLRDMLRKNFNHGEPIDEAAWESMKQIEMDRKEGKTEGDLGLHDKELELLDIIGTAVKRKKARHAGIGVLEHMKNRPMILIERAPSTQPVAVCPRDSIPAAALPCLPTHSTEIRSALSRKVRFIPAAPEIPLSRPAIRAFSTATRRHELHDPSNRKLKSEAHHRLTHLNSTGEAHMVKIPPPHPPPSPSASSTTLPSNDDTLAAKNHKPITTRTATAIAHVVFSNPQPYRLIQSSIHSHELQEGAERKSLPKGDVIATSRIAGIMAAKRTAELIPLCHNIPLAGVSVDINLVAPASSFSSSSNDVDPQGDVAVHGGIAISATVTAHAQTGVEMEALTAATVAGLSVYDMCKAVDRGMSLTGVRVVFKSGGRSGTWGDGVSIPEGQIE